MDRLTGKDAQLMMEALANVYEKKGDCVDKNKKTKHNCAKKVCSEQWGEGTCVPEHHTLLEDGTVTHYDVVFEHGLERMVPVEELEVLVTEMHEHAAMEGEVLDENRNQRGAAARLNREKAAAEEDRLYRAGGGDAKRRETTQMQGASQVRVRRAGMTRNQVIELGRKNLAAKSSTSSSSGSGMTPAQVKAAQDAANRARRGGQMSDLRGGGGNTGKSPISNLSNALDKPSVVSPKSGETTKFERRLPTMAELKAAQAARAKAKAGGATDREAGYQAAKAGVNAGKPVAKPATGAAAGSAAGGIRNPMKGKFTVDDKVSGTSNTYKPGQKMSTGDSATVKAAQSALRAGGSAAGAASKPAPTGAAGPAAKAAVAPVVKKKPAMGARNRGVYGEELDVFDTIKEYLIGEGATEEEALKQMLTLTDEQRTEIIEGSCGSKKKKKSKKGGY